MGQACRPLAVCGGASLENGGWEADPLRNSLIFHFFPPFSGFFNLFQSTVFDRGDFDAGDEGLFGIDLSVAGVEGADAGEL
jgi:hypothetical protein